MRTRLYLIHCVVLAALLGSACSSAPQETTGQSPAAAATPAADSSVTVDREIDGDSLELLVDGEVIEVRLLGINAPELSDCSGPAARDALGDLLDRGNLEIAGGETDRFGRALVWLEANGLDVNAAMVESGWALANHGDGDHLAAAMSDAATAGLGAWAPAAGDCVPISNDVRIIDAEPNPPGPDDEAMNDEYVVLVNNDTTPVDLDRWILRDESTGNRFTMPNFVLGAGAEVTVRTGCGTNTDTDIYWCSSNPVWSNRGETAVLLGPDGSYVSHYFF